MSLPRGRSLLRYEDESKDEIEMRFRKQKELQESLLKQIEERKMRKEVEKERKKEQDLLENQRIERERKEIQERRQQSQMKRLEKTLDHNFTQIHQFDAVQVKAM